MSGCGHAVLGAVTCLRGHPLRPCAALAGSCNGCRKLVLDGEQVMDCRACNFYLCGMCLPVAVQDPPLFRGGRRAEAVPPICVRNTFIDFKEERSPSQEPCGRRAQSCPPGQAEPYAELSPRARTPVPAAQPRAQLFPEGFELPEHLHGAVDYVAEELQEAMNQINEQGLATAVVGNVMAAVKLGEAALPAAVVMPAAPGSFWPQWAPAQAPASVHQQAGSAQGSAGMWGFFSSIDNAIAGTFDKVADEMKDAAQLIRDQGMARAVKSAVNHSLGGPGRDVVLQVRPPAQPPVLEEKLRPGAPALPEQPEEKPRHGGPEAGPGPLLSRGSAAHGSGTCKPCAFAAQGGPSACRNGLECQFCHLCEPGEKKRRRKTWHKNKREEKERAVAGVGKEKAPEAGGVPHLRSVCTAPGQLAGMGCDDEDSDEVLSVPAEKACSWMKRSASLNLFGLEEPDVLDWADASGF
mmetsp:Transcript_27172/g.75956  ORF Transcript_27172/g.75956 Transcript_27172/m.75956 type:complete len:465 (-) Transcript_27172:709-2103(-)